MFGLVKNEQYYKRMLSSMTPTIVEKNGFYDRWFPWRFDYYCAANDIECEYNFSMQEAVNAPRFHHQWLPI
jgi:gamma-glutamyltranspeptidase/glutathione hydrolase